MAWGFRKSFGFFGSLFRVNLSKSGIGASVGVPGLRFGVNSRGEAYRHSSIPGTGIYEREVLGRITSADHAEIHEPKDYVSFELRHSQGVVIAAFHRYANSDGFDDMHAENYGMSSRSDGHVITFAVSEHRPGSIVKIHYWLDTPDGRENALTRASGELRDDVWNHLLNYRDAILRNLDELINTENKTHLRLVAPTSKERT